MQKMTVEEIQTAMAYLWQQYNVVYTTSRSIAEIITTVIDNPDPQYVAYIDNLYEGNAGDLVNRMAKAFIMDAVNQFTVQVKAQTAAQLQPIDGFFQAIFEMERIKAQQAAAHNTPTPSPSPDPTPMPPPDPNPTVTPNPMPIPTPDPAPTPGPINPSPVPGP